MHKPLQVTDVRVRYGTFTAVRDVSITIEPGEVVGLVGESGSGKSSLAKGIVGLEPIAAGTIKYGSNVIASARHRRRNDKTPIQMIFQDPRTSFNPRRTVGQSLREVLELSSVPSRDHAARSRELIDQVSLDSSVLEMKPLVLSGGQLQRVAIARALAAEPAVIVADEITSSLDVSVQATVLNLLRQVQRDTGLSMLFVSHNLAVVRYVSDTICVMRSGEIVEVGSAEQITSRPQNPYTQELLDSVPTVKTA